MSAGHTGRPRRTKFSADRRLDVRLTDEEYKALMRVCHARDLSQSELVRKWIEEDDLCVQAGAHLT
jgi:hypothetical protein